MKSVIEEFWLEFLRVKGMDLDTKYGSVYHFGDDEMTAIRELSKVWDGKKNHVIRSVSEFENNGEKLPVVGMYSILTSYKGEPRLIVKTTEVKFMPAKEICDLKNKISEETTMVYETFEVAYRKSIPVV